MAKNVNPKKCKALAPEVDLEKIKKVKKIAAEAVEAPIKKRKATDDAAPAKVKKPKTPKATTPKDVEPKDIEPAPVLIQEPSNPKKPKTSGKDASESSRDLVATEPTKKEKISKKRANAAQVEVITNTDKRKKEKKEKPVKPAEKIDDASEQEIGEDDEESDIDDQTEALLRGFESDEESEELPDGEGYTEGDPIPERKQLTKRKELKLKTAESDASEKPGVVYVGRIPHGFYEHEMRAYFKQFGNILQLRVSRNKKTGASRHYAWIRFQSATVADIVARTMDNYLLFGHLLKVKIVPDDQIPKELFKGANKRFKKVPWNKMEGRKLEQGASEEAWDARIEREETRRTEKAKKLKAIGYEFEAPKLKTAKGVAKIAKTTTGLIVDEVKEAIEAAPVAVAVEADKPTAKTKKAKKIKTVEAAPIAKELVNIETEKGKTFESSEAAPVSEEPPNEKKVKKSKKAKKEKAVV